MWAQNGDTTADIIMNLHYAVSGAGAGATAGAGALAASRAVSGAEAGS